LLVNKSVFTLPSESSETSIFQQSSQYSEHSTSTKSVSIGQDVVVPCKFNQKSDKESFSWIKDGQAFPVTDKQPKYEIVTEGGNYNLLIKNATEQDSGTYVCQNTDKSLTMTTILEVTKSSSFELKPDIFSTSFFNDKKPSVNTLNVTIS
ncbi:unnamed protein product, partial [Didymodactylos carnosus]